jgi:hypothetical protein
LWLSCNFDPKERKLYLIMPFVLRASIWSRHLAHAGALHKPTLIFDLRRKDIPGTKTAS